jgi:hypothetical protein
MIPIVALVYFEGETKKATFLSVVVDEKQVPRSLRSRVRMTEAGVRAEDGERPGLKPYSEKRLFGTAEAVPFHDALQDR